jgi:hypothetical protein
MPKSSLQLKEKEMVPQSADRMAQPSRPEEIAQEKMISFFRFDLIALQ